MFDPRIVSLISGALPSPPHIIIERSLAHDIDELVAGTLPPMKLAVVGDANTRQALGDRVFRALKGRFACTHVTLASPSADLETADYLRTQTLSCDALVAVGSGTINDLCKYVSQRDGKPYIVFPTAASMNGYLSANTSLAENGYKKTFPAHMPKAVFCDLTVIAAAPAVLSKSGLGDSLARPTAQADWLLSHLLLGTPYNETPFELLASYEPELFENARGIARGDLASIELLVKTLLLSGLGMTIAGGSYPASQGEHMIAHAMEMMPSRHSREGGNPSYTLHGQAIGVTTLTMARMQGRLLRGKPTLRPDDFDEKKIVALFGVKVAVEAKKAFKEKQKLSCHASESGDPVLLDASFRWHDIVEKITPITLSAQKLESILKAADAPTTPEALGWNPEDYRTVVENARYLRDRFTFLDLVNPD